MIIYWFIGIIAVWSYATMLHWILFRTPQSSRFQHFDLNIFIITQCVIIYWFIVHYCGLLIRNCVTHVRWVCNPSVETEVSCVCMHAQRSPTHVRDLVSCMCLVRRRSPVCVRMHKGHLRTLEILCRACVCYRFCMTDMLQHCRLFYLELWYVFYTGTGII